VLRTDAVHLLMRQKEPASAAKEIRRSNIL